MVAIYFFYKERQAESSDSENSKLRNANNDLLGEVKALRKENKNLKDQLGLLPDDEYDYPARERKSLTTSKKKISVARLE